MSHSVYILDSLTKLQTVEQVLSSLHELKSIQDGEVGQGLLAFARKLEELAPQIEPENEYLSSLYAGLEQLVKENYKRLLPVDMPPNEWVRTLKLMVEIAKEVNVAIWDDSIGMAFLPNGKILPNDKAKLWKNAITELEQVSDFPMTLSAFKKFAQPKIEALAFKYGFYTKSKTSFGEDLYIRSFDELTHGICVTYYGSASGFCFGVDPIIRHENLTDIYKKFHFASREDILLEQKKIGINTLDMDITNFSELDSAINIIEEKAFYLLDNIKSINDIDRLLNGDLIPDFRYHIQHFFYMPQCLIAAYLANNPQFEGLCTSLGTYGEGSNRNWGANASARESEWPKLVKYLREEVKPLV